MNLCNRLARNGRRTLGVLCAGLAAQMMAQAIGTGSSGAANGSQSAAPTTPRPSPPDPRTLIAVDPSRVVDPYRPAFEGAKKDAKNGNIASAEQKLSALNVSAPNTAAWHVETGRKLMVLAEQLSIEADTKNATSAVNQCLQHLKQASASSDWLADAGLQARALAMTAFIQERYQGNPSGAIASYEAAVKANPTDGALKQALDRLQASYANAIAKSHSKKP